MGALSSCIFKAIKRGLCGYEMGCVVSVVDNALDVINTIHKLDRIVYEFRTWAGVPHGTSVGFKDGLTR
jgi:hypothetical protein